MGAMQRPLLLVALLLVLQACGAAAQQFQKVSVNAPCYTGVAQLVQRQDDCRRSLAPLGRLSAPFDPQRHLPWDCLSNMAISVEGCMVSMVSLVNMSQTLFNFSCSWLHLQGVVRNETHARMGIWTRPSAVSRYILRNADLAAAGRELGGPDKPEPWQEMLESLIEERAMLIADKAKPGVVVLTQNGRQCNTTYEVISGGVMGVGTVNRSSIGEIVVPSGKPFRQPYIIRGERPRWWLARARAIFIALIVMVSVFGALLLGCLGLLIWRLCVAGKRKKAGPLRGSPFDDGVAHVEAPAAGQHNTVNGIGQGVSSLESHSRRHGPTGGI